MEIETVEKTKGMLDKAEKTFDKAKKIYIILAGHHCIVKYLLCIVNTKREIEIVFSAGDKNLDNNTSGWNIIEILKSISPKKAHGWYDKVQFIN